MAGPVIPIVTGMARAAMLGRIRKGAGPFLQLQRLMEQRLNPPSAENPADVIPFTKPAGALGPDGKLKEVLAPKGGPSKPSLQELLEQLMPPDTADQKKFDAAVEGQKLVKLNKERAAQGKPPLDPSKRDLGRGEPLGPDEGPDPSDLIQQNRELAEMLAAEINAPFEPGRGPTAELMIQRRGLSLTPAVVEEGSDFVVQTIGGRVLGKQNAVGEMINIPGGDTQLTLIARNPETGVPEAISIPFADRNAALNALDLSVEFGPDGLADFDGLGRLQREQLDDMGLIDPDDIFDPDDLLASGRFPTDDEEE